MPLSNTPKRVTILGMKEIARKYLERDRVHYAGMLHVLDAGGAEILYAAADGVMLRSSELEYLSASSESAMRAMLALIELDDLQTFEPMFDEPLFARGFALDLRCRPCLYEGTEPVKLPPLPAGVSLRQLGHDHDEFIFAHYGHADTMDYVRERIDDGMVGLFEDGALAGFIGVHITGEMGLLEILPGYRRKGYAHLLEASLINMRLKAGLLPFCDVETENEPSLALQRGLGMTVSDRSCCWLVRDDRV